MLSTIAPVLQLTLTTDQIISVQLNLHTNTDRQLLLAIIEAKSYGERRAEIENRVYHMGTKPTPEAGYDDRLTTRLGCCASVAYRYLELGAQHKADGLRHTRLGKKYHIAERDVRQFEGVN